MADCPDDSEDATSSVGDEERVRRLFQACDGDGDGFIDGQDLLTVCRELNLEDSLEELMKELGADDQGRISYQEFLRRRIALRPEIEALRNSRPPADYLPTSSDNSNSLGEGKMSWEFDSGARDLSPEPLSLQQLVTVTRNPASGNLLELANKLHLAALSSLKGEILDLSNRLQFMTQERDRLEKRLASAELDKLKTEQKLEEERQLHEEQLTELHSVIAELTRKAQHQRALVIREEEDVSETDGEVSGVIAIQPDEDIPEHTIDVSSSSRSSDELPVEKTEDTTALLKEELDMYKADNAMLKERIARALSDLETISNRRNKKIPEVPSPVEVVRVGVARVSSPSRMVERSSPSLVPDKPPPVSSTRPGSNERVVPVTKVAERIRLKKTDHHVTGSEITTFGVCHTKVAEHLVSDIQEECDLQESSRNDKLSMKQLEIEHERLTSRLENVKSQNTVLALTLEECKAQCDKFSLLFGKYESNAIALKLALNSADQAVIVAESLIHLLESELSIVLSNCRDTSPQADSGRLIRRATDNRHKAERMAIEVLHKVDKSTNGSDTWSTNDEKKLRDHLYRLKAERNTVKSTVVELETPHVECKSVVSLINTVSEARKLDLETAVLMQELMSMREDKAELKARIYLLEKERTAQEVRFGGQNAQIQTVVKAIQQLKVQLNEDLPEFGQVDKEIRLKERMEDIVSILDKMTKSNDIRQQQNSELVLDLRAANTALVSSLDRCKKKYVTRLKKLETQMMTLVEKHAQQIQTFKQRISFLERATLRLCPESTI